MTEDPFPYLEEVFEFRSSLGRETDRGCALMAAAYLADQLERLLRRTFVDDKTAIDGLLRPLGPLGSFSGRIELCYGLGLLPNQIWEEEPGVPVEYARLLRRARFLAKRDIGVKYMLESYGQVASHAIKEVVAAGGASCDPERLGSQ